MWVLLMISFGLTSIGGPVLVTALPKSLTERFHDTAASCEEERARIEGEMRRAYPNETVPDYRLECQHVPKTVR